MAKKKKRRLQVPSLSALDTGIYAFLMVCAVAVGLFFYPMAIGQYRRSVYQDTHILAQDQPGTVFLCLFGLAVGGAIAMALDWLRRRKQPIFGKANIKYGPPQWKPVYPLLSKQFWKIFCANQKRLMIGVLCVLVFAVLVVSVTALGLPPGERLYDDGRICVYNSFREKTREYGPADLAEIRISTCSYSGWRGGYRTWGIEMEILMADGAKFAFSNREFHNEDENIHGAIGGMTQIKAIFDPGIITVSGKEALAKAVRDMNLNREETELLYRLFDAGEPPAA